MVDLALGLKVGNRELFLPGGTAQAILLRPRTLAFAARERSLVFSLSTMVLNRDNDFFAAFLGGGSLNVFIVTLLARWANLQT